MSRTDIKEEVLNKLDEVLDNTRVAELLGKKKEEEKKSNTILWVFAIIGAIAAVAGIAYAVYRHMQPDYLDDFEDDFEDDFDDDFLEEDEKEEEAEKEE